MKLLNEDTKSLLEQLFMTIIELRDEIEVQTAHSNCADVLQSVMHWAVDRYWNRQFLSDVPQVNTLCGPIKVVERMHKALEISRVSLTVSIESKLKHLENLCKTLVSGGHECSAKYEDWELSTQTVDWLIRTLRDSYKLNNVKHGITLSCCRYLQTRIDNLVYAPFDKERINDISGALDAIAKIKSFILSQSSENQSSDVKEAEAKCLAYIANLVKNIGAYKTKLHEAGIYTSYQLWSGMMHYIGEFADSWDTMKERLALIQDYHVRSCHASFEAKQVDDCINKLADEELTVEERNQAMTAMSLLLVHLDFYVREMVDTEDEVFQEKDQSILEALEDLKERWDEVGESTYKEFNQKEKQNGK